MSAEALAFELGFDEVNFDPKQHEMKGTPWDDLLDQMDGIEDPFERMAFALYMLMPAMLDHQEDELDGRAGDLEEIADLTAKLANIQERFNSMGRYAGLWNNDIPWEELDAEVGYLKADLWELLDANELAIQNGIIDAEIGGQVRDAIYEMIDFMRDLGSDHTVAVVMHQMWSYENLQDHGSFRRQYDDMKDWLDNLNTVGTSYKSVSAVAQTEMQFDIGFYEVMIGSYKDMFQNYKQQVQAALDGIKKS